MKNIAKKYLELGNSLEERAFSILNAKPYALDLKNEAIKIGDSFEILLKKRSANSYTDIAKYLLNTYEPEIAYFVAVEINEIFEKKLGYPPIGQITLALENIGGKHAAKILSCSLLHFNDPHTAQLAFNVFKSELICSQIKSDIEIQDKEIADFICTNRTLIKQNQKQNVDSKDSMDILNDSDSIFDLSDGIKNMPRKLEVTEIFSDQIFRHLQTISNIVIIFCPIIGAYFRGVLGVGIGFGIGLLLRMWMRYSMGFRGKDPDISFFIRMRERSEGSKRGLLEYLIEKLGKRNYSIKKCYEITQAWDKFQSQINNAKSDDEKLALIEKFDQKLKHISYT